MEAVPSKTPEVPVTVMVSSPSAAKTAIGSMLHSSRATAIKATIFFMIFMGFVSS